MSLVDRLVAYAADVFGLSERRDAPDEALAAVALLVHVARVDGALAPAEREHLTRIVRGRFAATAEEAEGLVDRAAAFDDETRDVAGLVEIVLRDAGEADRRRLLGLAYAVAAADGRLREFEEDLVWRVGRLLGFDDAAIVAARDGALAESRPAATVPAP
jgi:uncharacterized tellurite resistance protein B-like protein